MVFCNKFIYYITVMVFCNKFVYYITIMVFCNKFIYYITVMVFCNKFIYYITVMVTVMVKYIINSCLTKTLEDLYKYICETYICTCSRLLLSEPTKIREKEKP